jgi:hypothetical protein
LYIRKVSPLRAITIVGVCERPFGPGPGRPVAETAIPEIRRSTQESFIEEKYCRVAFVRLKSFNLFVFPKLQYLRSTSRDLAPSSGALLFPKLGVKYLATSQYS